MELILVNLALMVAATGSAAVLYKSHQHLPPENQAAGFMSSMAMAFIAAAALGQVTLDSNHQDFGTLKRMLDNLAYYASLPLLATAAFALGWQKAWSKAAWGRWLLVLFALFELFRRSGVGTEYSQFMVTAVCAVTLAGFLRCPEKLTRLMGIIAAVVLIMALMVTGPTGLVQGLQDDTSYRALLAGALLLLANGLSRWIKKGQ